MASPNLRHLFALTFIMKSKMHSSKQKRQEKTAAVLICLAVTAMVGFGAVYTVQLTPTAPTLEPKPVASHMNQLCQQKLLEHLRQGGLDLQAEMSYGDLQGCNFSSKSERGDRATRDIEMSVIVRDSLL